MKDNETKNLIYSEKNTDLQIIDCNTTFLELNGYKARQKEKLIGKTDFDLVWQDYAAIYSQSEKQVILTKKTYQALHPSKNIHNEKIITLNTVEPSLDKNGNIIKLISYAIEIFDTKLLEFSDSLFNEGIKYNIHYKRLLLSGCYEKFSLTNRENECLYYYLRGKTAKSIASILSISHRTVESHLANIKSKLNCTTKSQLIEKVLNENYYNDIPKTINYRRN